MKSPSPSSLSVSPHPTVANMGRLAREALGCQAELLSGGLGGTNKELVLQHLVSGHPVLIPYPSAVPGTERGRGGRGQPPIMP